MGDSDVDIFVFLQKRSEEENRFLAELDQCSEKQKSLVMSIDPSSSIIRKTTNEMSVSAQYPL